MPLTRRDDGFTLVELLISIAILGVIAVPLGNAIISYLHNSDATVARLSESHDAQLAQSYWAQDVGSIGTRDWSTWPFPLQQSVWTAAAGISNACSTTGTTVVQFSWDNLSGGSLPSTVPQIRVAYVVETVGAERQLHRVTCTATSKSAASSTPTSDAVLVHNLSSTGSATQVAAVSCSSTCTASSVPSSVSLALTIDSQKDTDGPYSLSLNGQRRQT
jgi:prepilin-type N-terminal cleavage/methylation domain-containing protein